MSEACYCFMNWSNTRNKKIIIMYSWQQKLRQRRINLWPWFFQNNSLQSSFSNIDLITTSSLGTYAQCYRDCFPCNFVKCTLVAQEIWIFELVNLAFFEFWFFAFFNQIYSSIAFSKSSWNRQWKTYFQNTMIFLNWSYCMEYHIE